MIHLVKRPGAVILISTHAFVGTNCYTIINEIRFKWLVVLLKSTATEFKLFLNLILSVFIKGVSMVLCVWDHIYSSVSAETLKKSSPLRLSGGSPGFSFTCNRWSGAISECSCWVTFSAVFNVSLCVWISWNLSGLVMVLC